MQSTVHCPDMQSHFLPRLFSLQTIEHLLFSVSKPCSPILPLPKSRTMNHRFDEVTKCLTLVAVHSRSNLIVAALAIKAITTLAEDNNNSDNNNNNDELPERNAADGFPILVAVADRSTGTVALLSCHYSFPVPSNPSSPFHATDAFPSQRNTRPQVSVHVACGRSDEVRGNNTVASQLPQQQQQPETTAPSPSPVPSLRLAGVWSCSETVTCLKAPKLTGSDDDVFSSWMSRGFVIGTVEGSVKTLDANALSRTSRVPRCSR